MTEDYHHMMLNTGTGAYLETVDWTEVDHVLLDMDGTLLDLAFDNDFWGQRIHEKYASIHDISVEQTVAKFEPLFKRVAGTLSWYSTDFWSQQYGYSIIEHSRAYAVGIRWLPFAKEFLHALRESDVRSTIVTNAHPDIVRLKHEITGITDLVDRTISSHTLGHAKESPNFWRQLQAELKFRPASTLFFDDSPAVLSAAIDFGIERSIAICHPDSTRPKHIPMSSLAINDFEQLGASLRRDDAG
jgi:HAD superfamily hydrolase (TIGR01509 family)